MDERKEQQLQQEQASVVEQPKAQRSTEDELYELISPSTAVLSSYTHDKGEGFKALER